MSVLIIDDEPAILMLAERLIERSDRGLKVVGTATGGNEGLRQWDELQPDVVVLDLRMPDIDGRTVATRIRASRAEQAIVLFSAHIDEVSTADQILHIPKTRMAELPTLIGDWVASQTDATTWRPPLRARVESVVTGDEREELVAILHDLHAEEAEQQSVRGHASQRISRAAARLDRILDTRDQGTRRDHSIPVD